MPLFCTSPPQHSRPSGSLPVLGAGRRQLAVTDGMHLDHWAAGKPRERHRGGEGRRQQIGLRRCRRRCRRRLLLGLLHLLLLRQVVCLLLLHCLRLALRWQRLHCLRCQVRHCVRLLLLLLLCLWLPRWRQHVRRGGASTSHEPPNAETARLAKSAWGRQRGRRSMSRLLLLHLLLCLLLHLLLLQLLLCRMLLRLLCLLRPLPLLPGRR